VAKDIKESFDHKPIKWRQPSMTREAEISAAKLDCQSGKVLSAKRIYGHSISLSGPVVGTQAKVIMLREIAG
jgi:hypothetical protein